MLTPFGYFDLLETLPQPGCVFCNLRLRDTDRFLSGFLYEYVNDPGAHRNFRASRGFCNTHSWQLKQVRGGSLGIAILYRAVLDDVLNNMQNDSTPANTAFNLGRLRPSQGARAGKSTAEKLEPTKTCVVCETLARNESRYAETFCELLTDEKLQVAFRASEGLCLPHFRTVLQQPLDRRRLDILVSIQQSIWTSLVDELDLFIQKSRLEDSQIHASLGSEGDSWSRAIARVSGEDNVFGIDPQ